MDNPVTERFCEERTKRIHEKLEQIGKSQEHISASLNPVLPTLAQKVDDMDKKIDKHLEAHTVSWERIAKILVLIITGVGTVIAILTYVNRYL